MVTDASEVKDQQVVRNILTRIKLNSPKDAKTFNHGLTKHVSPTSKLSIKDIRNIIEAKSANNLNGSWIGSILKSAFKSK